MRTNPRVLKLLADAITVGSIVSLAAWMLVWTVNDFADFDFYYELSNTLSYLAFSGVGLLIISRQPTNLIGWMCALAGFFNFLTSFANEYAKYAYLTREQELPLWQVGAVLPLMFWVIPVLAPPLLLPALFPDGKPLSRRWGYLIWLGVASLALVAVGSSLSTDSSSDVPNPLAVESLGPVIVDYGPALLFPWAVAFLGSVVSFVIRFRRSTGQARLQMKWFAYTLAVAVLLVFANDYVTIGGDESNVLFGIALTLIAGSIGIAVLRYRLYDIDRIINRTLVYGSLTAVLALIYFVLVVGLQAAFRPVSGSSDLAIALTTLVVAALFLPARQRVQRLVDRRFNRRAYDASRTLDAFSARLRQEVDLDTLRYELLTVVDDTMQPSRVTLWLRQQEAGR